MISFADANQKRRLIWFSNGAIHKFAKLIAAICQATSKVNTKWVLKLQGDVTQGNYMRFEDFAAKRIKGDKLAKVGIVTKEEKRCIPFATNAAVMGPAQLLSQMNAQCLKLGKSSIGA